MTAALAFSASALSSSVWLAVCAPVPEFVWQGLRTVPEHLGRSELLSALLIGSILGFCVDPILERIRDRLARVPERHREHREGASSAAARALVFALVSICLHDVLAAVISGGRGAHGSDAAGPVAALKLATAWALVPLVIALAWLSARSRAVGVPMAALGASSPVLTGWLFSWTWLEVVTTAIPCLLILAIGYRVMLLKPDEDAFRRCARVVGGIAVLWLVLALLTDATFRFLSFRLRLYNWSFFWIDARFYLGWIVGLMLAPSPSPLRVKI